MTWRKIILIMDLIPDPPGRIMGGSIFIDGFNIVSDIEKERER